MHVLEPISWYQKHKGDPAFLSRNNALRQVRRQRTQIKLQESAYASSRYKSIKSDPKAYDKYLLRVRLSRRKRDFKKLCLSAGTTPFQANSHGFKCCIIVALHEMQQCMVRVESDRLRIIADQREARLAEKTALIPIRKEAVRQRKNARTLAWREQNTEKYNAYMRGRRQSDVNARIADNLRRRINGAINSEKAGRMRDLVGCSIDELIRHLESQFSVGMTWSNYGKGAACWTIDHILPLASFDLTKETEQWRAFHWSNLKPAWFLDNCSKNSKVPWQDKAIRIWKEKAS